ncbi:MAG: MFS transporter [Acidimicrobiales bacterium]
MTDPAVAELDPPVGSRPPRLVTGRFFIVTLATFAYFLSLGSLLPTLPRYVTDELGGDGFAVGLVVGSFAVSAAIVRPWAGRIGDRYGRRVLLSGGALLVGLATLAYTQVDTVGPLVAIRLVTGLGEAAVFVGAATAVQDLAPAHRRGEAASYFSVALYSGLAFGPAIGERIADAYGYHEVWLAAGAAALVAAVLGLGTPHTRAPADQPRPTTLLHRAALGPGLVLLLGLIPFTGFAAFLAVYGPTIGLEDTGPVFFAYAGMVLAVRIFGAKLPDRLGWQRASTIALLAVAFGSGILAAWPSVAAVWVAAASLGVGMSLLFPALFAATLEHVPEHERSQAVGTFSLFFDLSQGLGAPVLGVVVALSSERGAFAAAALLAVTGFWAQRRLRHQVRRAAAEPVTTPA